MHDNKLILLYESILESRRASGQISGNYEKLYSFLKSTVFGNFGFFRKDDKTKMLKLEEDFHRENQQQTPFNIVDGIKIFEIPEDWRIVYQGNGGEKIDKFVGQTYHMFYVDLTGIKKYEERYI